MPGADIQFDARDILRGFAEVPGHLEDTVPTAIRLGADLVAARAKDVHDYEDQTGELTNSIAATPPTGSLMKGDLQAIVAAGAPHGGHLEYGTEDHFVKPVHHKALRWEAEGGYRFSKGHEVSGIRERAFLANALEHELDDIEGELEAAAELAFHRAGL